MVCWYECVLLFITSCLVRIYAVDPSKESCLQNEPACECVVYQSLGLSKGRFHSPNYPIPYKPGINCILYSFIGDFNEIVEIKFMSMDLRPPTVHGCKDRLRIFQQLDRPVVNELSKHDAELCGNMSNLEDKAFYSRDRTLILEFHTDPCKDRLRIFQQLDRPVVNELSKHDAELCGNMSNLEDKAFYSRGRALILEFHTDNYSNRSHLGFKGVYTFLEKRSFVTPGLVPGYNCRHFIQSGSNNTRGKFFSPRFPLKYPKSSNCQYIFSGLENEKVTVKFNHIRLPKHGPRCVDAGDTILVYDGKNSSAQLLQAYCDTDNSKFVTSSGPYMYIEFRSDRHREKQGFAAEFNFADASLTPTQPKPSDSDKEYQNPESESYNTITKDGTDGNPCDKTIESTSTRKNGTITSEDVSQTYVMGVTCEYVFIAQGRERVQLNFTHMDLHYTNGDAMDPFGCEHQDHVTVYVKLTKEWHELGTYCGKKLPTTLMSAGREMKVVFKSDPSSKDKVSDFRLAYFFRTDYAVSGTGIQDQRMDCMYMYNSSRVKSGWFTSPNYPGNYPGACECNYIFNGGKKEKISISFDVFKIVPGETNRDFIVDTEHRFCTFMFRSRVRTHGYFTSPNFGGFYPKNTACHYIFFGRRNERVQIHFPFFDVDGIVPRCDSQTDSDAVSFSNFEHAEDAMMPRYCGNTPRRDFLTSDGAFFKVTFKSNEKFDAMGFRGKYSFVKSEEYETPTTSKSNHSAATSAHVCISRLLILTLLLICKTVITIS